MGTRTDVEEHSAHHIAVKVQAANGGVLVLSELYYPGWEARVNGTRSDH